MLTQGFAASLLLTPLFFSGFLVEFSGSNEKGRGVGAYIGGYPGRPWGGGRQAPLPRPWAGPSGRPRGGRQAPLSPVGGATGPPFFYSRDFVANLKKNYI